MIKYSISMRCRIALFINLCLLLYSCGNNDLDMESGSEFNNEEMMILDECHRILDEYKDCWSDAPGYSDFQRDSMLLKIGVEGLRDLLSIFTEEWNQQGVIKSTSRGDRFTIYGTHKSILATSRSTMVLDIRESSVRVIDATLEVNPSGDWRTKPFPEPSRFNEKGHAVVGAEGVMRVIGRDFQVLMSGYVDKVPSTIGYEGKVEHCRVR